MFVILALGLFACESKSSSENKDVSTNEKSTMQDIPYEEAKNYFVKNTYENENLVTLKLTTSDEFNRIFGMATTMSERPTPLDFSKEYVLAIIAPVNNKSVSISINNLQVEDKSLVLKYAINEGEEQSSKMHPASLIVVGNQYSGTVLFEQED